jgi:hypothetical protein
MSVYTVHEPPVRSADPLPDAERIVFVRDGFSFWAFLLAPLWMLWHRMWLVLAGYVIVAVALETALAAFGGARAAASILGLFISLLVGLEASTLRRFTLNRRGWLNVGIVSGASLEDAERRYFEAWVQELPSQRAAPMASPPAPPPASGTAPPSPRAPQGSDVVGLFPEPGKHQ